jgi:YD repeat-containing protein
MNQSNEKAMDRHWPKKTSAQFEQAFSQETMTDNTDASRSGKSASDTAVVTGLTNPESAVVDAEGRVFVTVSVVLDKKQFPALHSPNGLLLDGASHLLYADYVSGRIWALRYDDAKRRVVENRPIPSRGLPILSFGEDEKGEVYFLTATVNGQGVYWFSK